MTKAYFIAGTDTEIGKTFVSCALLHAWRARGYIACGYKPVAAGAVWHDDQLANDDAIRLMAASSPGFDLANINPICLPEAIAPHIAAARVHRTIDTETIVAGFHALAARCDRIAVEGVGGLLVPLNDEVDASAIPLGLDLPVILVVGLRLGCLNHALLTAEALRARGLTIAGWVANTLAPPMPCLQENVDALQQRLAAPCLGLIPHLADPADAVSFLDMTPLGL